MDRRGFLALSSAFAALPFAARTAVPLNVVATTGMIADTVSRIGGAHVAVTGLMGAGVDPHAYRQTRSDIVAMTRADLVFWHGLFLEAQMESFFDKLAARQPVVAVTDQLEAAMRDGGDGVLIKSKDYEDAFDPHIWMDPTLWSQVADRIEAALAEEQPEAAGDFAANADKFRAEAAAIKSFGQQALAQIPKRARLLVTAHDAFSYFGRAFDMDVIGVQGISTESEAGLHRISELVELLVERDIEAIFVESSVSDRNMRALIEGAAAKGHDLRLGGELYSDAMGPAGTYEGTYLGMMDHNITTIARALGADVPQRGLNGRLGVDG